jgi:hypothetical protein
MIHEIPPLGTHPKECKSRYKKGTCIPMFIAALVTIPNPWKHPRCPTNDEWIKKIIYTQWNFIQPQRRMKFCCLQVNGWNWRTAS